MPELRVRKGFHYRRWLAITEPMTVFKAEFIAPTSDRLANEQPVFTLSKLGTDLRPERRETASPVRGLEDLVKHLVELSGVLRVKDPRFHLASYAHTTAPISRIRRTIK